jgi:hypothetical protein
MKYVYLPEAFLPALKAAGIALHGNESAKTLTSVERLSGILSPSDVAFYWYLNIYTRDALPAPVTASMVSALKEVFNPERMAESTDPRLSQVASIFQGYVLNDNAPYLPLEGKVLVAQLLDEDTIIFTHQDGEEETERDMYDRIIRTMNALIPFHEIAAMPLFGGYLRAAQSAFTSAAA